VSDGERGPWMFEHRAPSIANPLGDSLVDHYAGIDVSLELSSVCIVDATGDIEKEAKVEGHPDALWTRLEADYSQGSPLEQPALRST